ncbi:MAG: LptF/LptG family permease [Bacteroidaceae bacterium]|nr:LptF/LptG family permease [Bacteroidaceae bacterium]
MDLRIKKLDRFLLKSFLLLFAGTFFICLFILMMNILWRYVEDLVGKGFTLDVLAKFFYYSALTLVPMALPLAVLLASLITFGNFGERCELIAMKTAGISLMRVMKPLIIFCVILAGISFYFQNVAGPNAQKNLYSLVWSMEQKNPELEIPEGTFYDEIAGYNMYVKHKDPVSGMLYDVTIYDVSKGFEEIRVIVSDSGSLETTADKQHLYMHLYSGEQFENMQAQTMARKDNPYRRESFREKHILIDFNSDFNLVDASMMSSQAASKNMRQIKETIDSLSQQQDSIGMGNYRDYRASAMNTFALTSKDSALVAESAERIINTDSLFLAQSKAKQLDLEKAIQTKVNTQKSDLSLKGVSMFQGDRTIRRHWIEWMKKISLCTSILVFFFIGAPLGAIIRKGGLGVPVLVSVMTFILYYITSISGEKMFREGEWSIVGCWLSTIVLFPLSVFFTVTANKDSTLFQLDPYREFFRYWFGGRPKRNIVRKEVIIEDPDPVTCSRELDKVGALARQVLASGAASGIPSYGNLFFGDGRCPMLRDMCREQESVVEQLGNSQDRVVLDLINTMPIVPYYGIESPFENRKVNKVIGICFPVALLLGLRAWLFSRKINRQLNETVRLSERLSAYLRTGQLSE